MPEEEPPRGTVPDQQTWQVDAGADLVPASPPPPAAEAPPPIPRILEALLFVGGEPVTVERACATIRGLTPAQLTEIVDQLNQDYRRQGRPYTIQAQGQGYVMILRQRFRPVVEKLHGTTREARLSMAAIDVLSLVAYRQPVGKQEVETIRGAESGSLLRQLVRRGLIAISHSNEAAPKEAQYSTTPRFLELFGLRSLDDLPQTQDLQKL